MKKVLLTLALTSLFAIACKDKHDHHDHGTHVHEDGSVHKEHDTEVTPTQEEFDVASDSTVIEEHHHKEGDAHQH